MSKHQFIQKICTLIAQAAEVLSNPRPYPNFHGGFAKDCQALRGDFNKVAKDFNWQIRQAKQKTKKSGGQN